MPQPFHGQAAAGALLRPTNISTIAEQLVDVRLDIFRILFTTVGRGHRANGELSLGVSPERRWHRSRRVMHGFHDAILATLFAVSNPVLEKRRELLRQQ